jgi:hypothetical protein
MANLSQVSVTKFKEMVGANSFDIVESPSTGKLFAAGDNGKNYKVEAAIDFKKEIVVLVDNDDVENSCFINKRADGVKISL